MALMIKSGSESLGANSSGTISIDVSAGKRYTIDRITFSSTGTFKITAIKDTSTGYNFVSGDLVSANLKNKANTNVIELSPAIELTGSTSLVFEITDTSGSSNTVYMTCWGNEE